MRSGVSKFGEASGIPGNLILVLDNPKELLIGIALNFPLLVRSAAVCGYIHRLKAGVWAHGPSTPWHMVQSKPYTRGPPGFEGPAFVARLVAEDIPWRSLARRMVKCLASIRNPCLKRARLLQRRQPGTPMEGPTPISTPARYKHRPNDFCDRIRFSSAGRSQAAVRPALFSATRETWNERTKADPRSG